MVRISVWQTFFPARVPVWNVVQRVSSFFFLPFFGKIAICARGRCPFVSVALEIFADSQKWGYLMQFFGQNF
jgi:hypothetical protein